MDTPPEQAKSTTATYGGTPTVPVWKNPQILAGIGGVAGGVIAVCQGFHIPIPISFGDLTLGLGGMFSVGAAGYFIYRRIRAGLDPSNPTPKITVT
jgi:hypothetical protein